ncbi:unnamed protein product [Leptidea sinapis]|uniref:Uncharacterized protein n=1 Tax=Leptidea sinapis TaxID=189913 RepID=A0A5E4QXQ1_9NEOP|nr:unnamed protein product [Leptidea sinapis]
MLLIIVKEDSQSIDGYLYQCLQRLGSGGDRSSPAWRCGTGMAAHPAAPPPFTEQAWRAPGLQGDRISGCPAATEPQYSARPGR